MTGRRASATIAALIAVSAYGGAVGLATGVMNLGSTATGRLPLQSPVLGGLALAAIVGVPSTATAWLAVTADRRAAAAAIGCGVLLIGWILAELAFIRELSFLQPLYLALGLLLIILGLRSR